MQKKKAKPKTRHAIEEKRKYNRIKKQESRARQGQQKKRRIKEYDRKRHRKENVEVPRQVDVHKVDINRMSQPENEVCRKEPVDKFCSPEAKRQAVSRVKKVIPKAANKFADVVSGLISRASPSKKRALRKAGISSPKK